MISKKKSPYNLLQEIYWPDEWKILVCCMFLNLTTGKQVKRILDEFFDRYPNALVASRAKQDEMIEIIKSLGLSNKRSKAIIKMSTEYCEKDWKQPIELHGLGQYAQDSYDIFIKENINIKNPSDHVLQKYLTWAQKEAA